MTRDDIHNYLEEGLCASAGGSAGGSEGSSASGRVHNLGLKLIVLDYDFDSDIEQAALQRQPGTYTLQVQAVQGLSVSYQITVSVCSSDNATK